MTDSLTLGAPRPGNQRAVVPATRSARRLPSPPHATSGVPTAGAAGSGADDARTTEYWLGTLIGGRVVLGGLVGWLGVAGWVVTSSLLLGLLVVVLATAALGLTILAL